MITQILKPLLVFSILAVNYLVITYGPIAFFGIALSILLAVFLAIYFKFKVVGKNTKLKHHRQNPGSINKVKGHIHNAACEQADPHSICECMCKGRYHAMYSRYITV